MTDLSQRHLVTPEQSDSSDCQDLAYEEIAKLHVKRPDHPLLKYFLDPGGWLEFLKDFGKRGISPEEMDEKENVDYAYRLYYLALRQANEDPDAKILK